ncbi:MAG: hypothetical protein JXB05_28390 [Myxococcaceae bacterium]|nr:hypothetical protein [Myxococcaceae bacterium]
MHALLILSAVLASQPSIPEPPDKKPPPARKENHVSVHPTLLLGLGTGGETMAEFVYTDGSTKSIKAGGLLQAGAGLIIDFSGIPLQLQSTVSYHFDTLEASNGDASFSRWPVEALGFYKIGDFRLGGGLQYVVAPKAHLALGGSEGSMLFNNNLGFVAEAGWVECRSLCYGFNLRFVYQGYVANGVRVGGWTTPTTSERINGNHIAGNLLLGF